MRDNRVQQHTESAPESTQRALATLEKIYKAAEIEFSRFGLEGAKIDDIARQANVSKPLIYHYFKKKEDLYAATIKYFSTEFFNNILAVDFDRGSPTDVIHDLVHRFELFFGEYPHRGRLILDQIMLNGRQVPQTKEGSAIRLKIFDKLSALIARGVLERSIASTVTAPGLHFLLLVLTLGYTTIGTYFEQIKVEGPTLAEMGDRETYLTNLVLRCIKP